MDLSMTSVCRRRMSTRGIQSQKTQQPKTQNKTTKSNQRRRRNRRRSRNIMKRSFATKQFAAPTTIGSISKIYSNLQQNGNTARLSFCELFPVTIPTAGCSSLIFINPSKWPSTRTYDQARLYTTFRPKFISVEFISNVATNTPGLLSFGSYYGNSHPDYTEDLFLRLPQTEGGFISSVWQSCHSKVACGTALKQNKFSLQMVTEEDIPITLVTIVNGTNMPVGSVVGYLAVAGAFLLTGPRTTKIEENVSGSYTGQIQIENDNAYWIVDDKFHCFAADQNVEMKVSDINTTQQTLLQLQNGTTIDWKKIFKVFTNVLGKVVSVVGTVCKIVLAVAPIVLATPGNGPTNTGVHITANMIGKLTEGSVDIEENVEPTTTYTNLNLSYPQGVLLKESSNFSVTFANATDLTSHITFTIDNNNHLLTTSFTGNREVMLEFKVSVTDNWASLYFSENNPLVIANEPQKFALASY